MKQLWMTVVVVGAFACSKKSPAPAQQAGSGSAAAAAGSAQGSGSAVAAGSGSAAEAPGAPHCLQRGEDLALARLDATDKAATLCVAPEMAEDKKVLTCETVDLATGAWSKGTPPPDVKPSAPDFAIKQDAKGVHVCKGTACKTLAVKAPAPAEEGGGVNEYLTAVSVDGKRAVVAGDDLKGAELYDATSGKKVKAITLFKGPGEGCMDTVAFVGEYVYVATNVCAGPGASGAFYNWSGKEVAKLEGVNPYGYAPLDLGNNLFAFGDLNGSGIGLFDAKAGKARAVMVPEAAPCEDCNWLTAASPEGQAGTVKTPGNKLVVVDAANVYVIDPAAGVEKTYKFPLCAAK